MVTGRVRGTRRRPRWDRLHYLNSERIKTYLPRIKSRSMLIGGEQRNTDRLSMELSETNEVTSVRGSDRQSGGVRARCDTGKA